MPNFNYWDKINQDYQKKLAEELQLSSHNLPPDVMKEFASRVSTPPEYQVDPANYEVNVSDNTAVMGGKLPMPSDVKPEAPKAPRYTVEEDLPAVPAIAPKAQAAPVQPVTKRKDEEADAVLSAEGSDDARRQAELAALNKKGLGNKLASFGAGVGDAISASAAPFGGNAPGGFQQRLMERQDKQTAMDKKDIEDRIRNDANSDISKQYQALVAQFLRKDPSDPSILGLTANQIVEKIPQIEKLASFQQAKELKQMDMAADQSKLASAAGIKAQEGMEKQELAAAEAKQQADVVQQSIQDIFDKKLIGWDTTGPGGMKVFAPIDKPNLEAKLDTIKANIAFDKLNKLRQASPTGGAVGQVSDKDMVLLQSVLGSLSTDQSPQELKQSLKRISEIFKKFQGYGTPSQPSATETNQTPSKDSSNLRKTKSGFSYSIEG